MIFTYNRQPETNSAPQVLIFSKKKSWSTELLKYDVISGKVGRGAEVAYGNSTPPGATNSPGLGHMTGSSFKR